MTGVQTCALPIYMEIRPLTPTEQKYTYAQSMQIEGQTGTIGHLRGDFATTGYGFYTCLLYTSLTLMPSIKYGISSIMEEEKPNQREKPAFRDERITKLIPKSVPRGQESDFVVKALEFYNRHLQRQRSQER